MSAVSDRTQTPGDAGRRRRAGSGSADVFGVGARLWSRWNEAEPFSAPSRADWPLALRRLWLIGLGVLVVQLLVWGWWSALVAHRSALTWDYSLYNQAVYLIAHGHLDPYSSTFGFPFWQNDGEFIFWPVAILERMWPHVVTLKWAQDLAIVAAEAVAFTWICEIAAKWHAQSSTSVDARPSDLRLTLALASLGLLMLVADPWLTWAISFDAHAEPFVVPFVIAAARALYRGRPLGLLWLVFVIAGGAVPATYAGALGLTLVVSGRRWWKQGLAIAVVAFGWESVLHALNAAHGAGIGGLYWKILGEHGPQLSSKATLGTLMKALIHHPGRGISALWSNKVDIWATVAPLGLVGVFWMPALIPSIVVLAEGGLTQGYVFSFPGFQNAVLAPLIAVGTISACFALATRTRRRRSWLPWAVCGLLTANAVVWGAVWIPESGAHWLRVPSDSSRVLSKLRSEIRPADEVIAQQGITGAFSGRAQVYALLTQNATIPVKARRVWVIFAPEVGVETADIAGIYSDIGRFSTDPAMHLRAASNGVFAFEFTPARGQRHLTIGAKGHGYTSAPGSAAWAAGLGLTPAIRTTYEIPAWVAADAAGRAVRKGPVSAWHAASNGKPGYVIAQDYWSEPPGRYKASVSLSVSGMANVELWDATNSTLFERVVARDTHGRVTVTLHGDLPGLTAQPASGGWGLWSAVPHPPVAGDDLEIRVWSPGGHDRVDVYTARIQ